MIVTDTEIPNPAIPNLRPKALVEQLCRQNGFDSNRLASPYKISPILP